MQRSLLAAALLVAAAFGPAGAQEPRSVPKADVHVREAEKLAGSDLTPALRLCSPEGSRFIGQLQNTVLYEQIQPTKLFDNLFYVGNKFVGVFVLKTSAGLLLFDSGISAEDAQTNIAPGLRALGLDPKDVKYVIVTHGHWDHFGGSAWFQKTSGARVGLSATDWDLMKLPSVVVSSHTPEPPTRDLVIADGQKLRLGDTEIAFYITPGHTPGPISAIFPVYEGGKRHVASLLGGTAFPGTLEANERTGGLIAYQAAIERFSGLSRQAGADVLLNTHLFAIGGVEWVDRARAAGGGGPFVVGGKTVARYYALLDQCLQSAQERVKAGTAAGAKASFY